MSNQFSDKINNKKKEEEEENRKERNEIKTDYLISIRQLDLIIVKKKEKKKRKKERCCRRVNFGVLDDHRVKLEKKKK